MELFSIGNIWYVRLRSIFIIYIADNGSKIVNTLVKSPGFVIWKREYNKSPWNFFNLRFILFSSTIKKKNKSTGKEGKSCNNLWLHMCALPLIPWWIQSIQFSSVGNCQDLTTWLILDHKNSDCEKTSYPQSDSGLRVVQCFHSLNKVQCFEGYQNFIWRESELMLRF